MQAASAYLDALDMREEILARRRLPCICPRQHEATPPVGVSIDVAMTRGIEVERVRCATCARTWQRINVPA